MSLNKQHVVLLFLAAGVCFGLDNELSPEKAAKLRNFIKSVEKCHHTAGIGIALVKDGQTLFAEGFGYRDMEKKLPFLNNTRTNIGSLTKAFTATLVADAVSKGQLKWDQPLREILGNDFRLQDDFRTEQASMRDILSHRLGMPSYWGVTTAVMNVSRADLCMKKLQHFPVNYDFRSRFEYSNFLYVLAGYVTEKLRGKTWEDDVTKTLFKALGMEDTRVTPHLQPSDWETTAKSYFRKYNSGEYMAMPEIDRLPMINNVCPAGCIFSSAIDMAKWMKFHLSGGKNEEGKQIVPKSALSELFKANAVAPTSRNIGPPTYLVDDRVYTVGMGFFTGTYRGHQKEYHTGAYNAYACRLTLLPESSIGVWVCTNGPGRTPAFKAVSLMTDFSLDLLLDVKPWLDETTACSYPAPWANATVPTPPKNGTDTVEQRPDKDFVGVYEHAAFGDFTVYLEGDSLRYKFGRLMHGTLNASETKDTLYMNLDYPLEPEIFVYGYLRGFPVMFYESDGSNGKIDEVKVPFLENDMYPVFKKSRDQEVKTNGDVRTHTGSSLVISLAVVITASYFH